MWTILCDIKLYLLTLIMCRINNLVYIKSNYNVYLFLKKA